MIELLNQKSNSCPVLEIGFVSVKVKRHLKMYVYLMCQSIPSLTILPLGKTPGNFWNERNPYPRAQRKCETKKNVQKPHTGPLVSENPAKNHNTSDRKTVLKC